MKKYKHQLDRLVSHYNHVEYLVKTYELRQYEVLLPAINELRYAGRRAIDIMALLSKENEAEPNSEKVDQYFVDAELACIRAKHDIVDALVLYGLSRIQSLNEKYDFDELVAAFPKFNYFSKFLLFARREIQRSREFREERNEIYSALYEKLVPDFLDFMDEVDANFDQLVQGERKRQYFQTLSPQISFGWILGGLGIGGSAILALIQYIWRG
ncbi:hypothetical protein [Nisaea sediminum]|uniref:hypothetical protein n=1 Tax=Nisaea sediminum TaxID=2775867 RepID=UPI001868F120|nr:hypothetical protein [Nisaea sediminum]